MPSHPQLQTAESDNVAAVLVSLFDHWTNSLDLGLARAKRQRASNQRGDCELLQLWHTLP